MPRRPSRSSRHRSGISLIEVVASIVLLVTMFMLLLKGWNQHQRQIRQAERRLQAVRLVDEQLVTWYSSVNRPPVDASGVFSGGPPFYWKTRMSSGTDNGLPSSLRLLQLQVYGADHQLVLSTDLAVNLGGPSDGDQPGLKQGSSP